MSQRRDPAISQLVGKNIRKLRRESGWTQEHLAEKIHIEPESLSRYENGHRTPNLPMLVQIASIFGVLLDDLVARPAGAGAESVPGPHGINVDELASQVAHIPPETRRLVLPILKALSEP